MKTETYNKLREIVIRANPDILKLEFGCEFCRFSDQGIVDILASFRGEIDGGFTVAMQRKGTIGFNHYSTTRDDVESWKILGRPIRLADVLLAISKEEFASGFTAHPNGDLSFTDYLSDDGQDGSCSGVWNLLKDDLRDQSDECGEFLLALLEER